MSNPVVIIDPGHGGRDCGCRFENIFEKDLALRISLYQLNRFRELGISAVITRHKDVYLDPDARTRIIRESKAEYCISNHINAGGGYGCEVIHSIFNNGKLAQKIFEELKTLGLKGRSIYCKESTKYLHKDYYFIHRDTGNCITNIIEYGFIDNKEDREKLLNKWEEYAEGVVKVFCGFIDHLYIPKTKFVNIEDIQFKDSIQKLFEKGIINSPEYWITNREYKGEYVRELIENIGKTI